MGTDLGIVKLHIVCSVKQKQALTACAFLLNYFLLNRALEGALFWCNIKISCLLLSLQIVFEALHLLCAQTESVVGH